MRYVAGAMTYNVRTLYLISKYYISYFSLFLQLDLPRGVVVEGELIHLKSHGGLCAPTDETLTFTLKYDEAFNLMHGEGSRAMAARSSSYQ